MAQPSGSKLHTECTTFSQNLYACNLVWTTNTIFVLWLNDERTQLLHCLRQILLELIQELGWGSAQALIPHFGEVFAIIPHWLSIAPGNANSQNSHFRAPFSSHAVSLEKPSGQKQKSHNACLGHDTVSTI